MKRASWLLGCVVAVMTLPASLGIAVETASAQAKKPEPAAKETPLKGNAALKPKIDKRLAPFTWGMSSEKVFAELDKRLDETYQKKITAAYNPKQQAALERELDKKKKDLRTKLVAFSGTGGVSGYEVKAPGEFTYRNNESVLEVPGQTDAPRHLFFISDRLWKIYEPVVLGGKDAALGDSFESAFAKVGTELADKGKMVPPKSPAPAYYGTLIQIPGMAIWSDGTTQVRLVDHTRREDTPDKTVGLAFEEINTIEKLPSLRSKVEAKASDMAVDKAGFTAPPPKDDKKPADKKPVEKK